MNDQPRQVCIKGEAWQNGEWVGAYFAWENTGKALTEDELRDIAECYNQLLIQQFAAMLDFGN